MRKHLEETSWREPSWRRHLEGLSWRRHHGGGIWRRHLDEASWMRNHGGDIMEEASGGGAGLAWLAWLAWLAQFTYVKRTEKSNSFVKMSILRDVFEGQVHLHL